jgi:hypothetical protein
LSLPEFVIIGYATARQHTVMMNIEELFTEIEALSERDFLRLRQWFAEKEWERWDQQLEIDVADGKLVFLIREALSAKEERERRDLEILNTRADYLNAEMADVLLYTI